MAHQDSAVDIGPVTDDYDTRLHTYRSFLRIIRYVVAGIVLVLIFLAWNYG